jgi:UDP-GlcNAc:undecaprenyl-phosphate GlcNAc-1-phosphate transferase
LTIGALLAVAFAAALIVALAGVPLVRRLAIERELLDEPGGRKVHATAVPRLGGAAMLCAFFIGLGAALWLGTLGGARPALAGVPALLLGVVAVSVLGLLDDLFSLPALAKLVGQTVVAVLVVSLGLRVETLAMPWGTLELGLAGAVISVAWLVAIVNAMNLVDGLDGLAGSVALTAMLAYGVIGLVIGADGPPLLLASGCGAVLGFLFYNRPPASIIMGDTGSMFLGFLLAGTAILLSSAAPGRASVVGLVLALALPIADTLFAIVRRLLAGQSVFAADSRHIHHQMVASGTSPIRVVLILGAASAICGALGVLLTR